MKAGLHLHAAFATALVLSFAAADVPSPAAEDGGRLGVGMECLDRDLWDWHPAIPHLKELGIKSVRLQSGWARTERKKGVYDFKWLDDIVDGLAAIGVRPWISLSYGNPIYAVPEEGEQDYTGQKMFPMRSEAGRAAWAAYVTAIVKRYAGRVRAWEIWNEPDVKSFLHVPKGSSWAKEYAAFVRFTSRLVKSADPGAVVAACTAAGPGAGGAVELFAEGIAADVDVYSFHAYTAVPEQMTPAVGKAFFSAVRKYAPNVRFWRGEAGISSVKSGYGALSDLPLSEAMQARWMGRHLVRDLADPDISFTSWFHLSAFEHFSHTRTYHYGVLRDKDWSHKPSFDVLRRVKQFFDDGRVAPDQTICLMIDPIRGQPGEKQAKAVGTAVYGFRRNGLPLFAFSSVWPAHEEMAPVKARTRLFVNEPGCVWRDPVLFDLTSGEVKRLKPGVRELTVEVANHIKVLTEAAALAPHIKLEPSAAVPAPAPKSGQANHE